MIYLYNLKDGLEKMQHKFLNWGEMLTSPFASFYLKIITSSSLTVHN